MQRLRISIWYFIFLGFFFLGMGLGLCAPFGLGHAVFGEAVSPHTPVGEMPLGWFIILGALPGAWFGFWAVWAFMVMPLAPLFRIPLFDEDGWRRADAFYRFLKRSPQRRAGSIVPEDASVYPQYDSSPEDR